MALIRQLKLLSDSSCAIAGPVSVVIPIYNEVESLPLLVATIEQAMQGIEVYEVICVDDGSSDGSADWLRQYARDRANFKAILLRRNYGQTAAMAAGFNHAQGEYIITLDGDLQNDPTDIPRLLSKLEAGYDLVSGWRQQRQDHQLTRLLPSKVANWLISCVTGVELHDYGCSLKAYRAEILRDMHLYGELHRFCQLWLLLKGLELPK